MAYPTPARATRYSKTFSRAQRGLLPILAPKKDLQDFQGLAIGSSGSEDSQGGGGRRSWRIPRGQGGAFPISRSDEAGGGGAEGGERGNAFGAGRAGGAGDERAQAVWERGGGGHPPGSGHQEAHVWARGEQGELRGRTGGLPRNPRRRPPRGHCVQWAC